MNTFGSFLKYLAAASILLFSATYVFAQTPTHQRGKPSDKIATEAAKPPEQKLQVDGVAPLFLVPTDETQSVRIVGKFPDDIELKANDPLTIPSAEQRSISPGQILVDVKLHDVPAGQESIVSIEIQSKSTHAKTQAFFHIRPIPAACDPSQDSGGQINYQAPGAPALCKINQKGFGVNALTKAVTANLDANFCKNATVTSNLTLGQTYLNPKDSTAITVCNKNPFNYSTKLVVNEELIQDDDLSAFLGILDPMLGASQAANTASNAAATKSTAKSSKAPKSLINPAQVTFSLRDPVQECLNSVVTRLGHIEEDYSTFLTGYQSLKSRLEDDNHECSERLADAQKLSADAAALTASPKLRRIGQSVTSLLSEIDQRVAIVSSGEYKDSDLTQQQVGSMKAAKDALKTQNCIAQKATELIYQNVGQKVLIPVNSILGHNDSFSYSYGLGLYQQPTRVKWELRSKAIDKTNALPNPSDLGADPYQTCFTTGGDSPAPVKKDKSQALELNKAQYHVASLTYVRDYLTSLQQRDAGNDSKNNSNAQSGKSGDNGKNPPTGNSPSTDSSQDGALVRAGTLTFGGPRFIVSAGVAGVTLRQQEFQKAVGQALDANGKPISGQSAVNTIQFKTNDSVRISPLIMAHTRIYSYKGSDKAVWGTVGVTGKPDNLGTSPEYLFGLSQSLWDNWMFITGGLYVGKKQSLTPGLFVGEAVPSTLTGDIPVQKNYKAGFGLAISFRIPKTDAPKTKSTDSSSASSSNKTGSKTNQKK